jgi:hypothetical protein
VSRLCFWVLITWGIGFVSIAGCYGKQAHQELLDEKAWTCELKFKAPSFDYPVPKIDCWYDGINDYAFCECDDKQEIHVSYKKFPGGQPFEAEEIE